MKGRDWASPQPQVLRDHVRELRTRLFVCAIVLVVAGGLGYFFFDQILSFLKAPLHAGLYYNSPSGSFGFVMKICTMVGIAITLPVIIYNLIMFLQPAFEKVLSMGRVASITTASIILALSGAAFGYYFIIPGALRFFAGFQVDGLSALITADSYLGFVTSVIITFVIVFQIPLLMMLFDRVKPIPPKRLFKMEKYVVLAGLLVSVVVPFAFDLVTCLLIAAPIIVLYNLSVGLIIWQHAVQKRQARAAEAASERELAFDDALTAQMLGEPEFDLEAQLRQQLAISAEVTAEQAQGEQTEPALELAIEPDAEPIAVVTEAIELEFDFEMIDPITTTPVQELYEIPEFPPMTVYVSEDTENFSSSPVVNKKQDIFRVDRTAMERMQRAITEKRAAVRAARAARIREITAAQPLRFISDIH